MLLSLEGFTKKNPNKQKFLVLIIVRYTLTWNLRDFTCFMMQENVGWAAGFGVLAGILAMALILFLVGAKKYRIDKKSTEGSPYTKVVQVVVAAARKWRLSETRGGRGVCYEDDDAKKLGQSKGRILDCTNQLRYVNVMCQDQFIMESTIYFIYSFIHSNQIVLNFDLWEIWNDSYIYKLKKESTLSIVSNLAASSSIWWINYCMDTKTLKGFWLLFSEKDPQELNALLSQKKGMSFTSFSHKASMLLRLEIKILYVHSTFRYIIPFLDSMR